MKKKNLIATLAIIALSATSVTALEFNTEAAKEMAPEIKVTVEQELKTVKQSLPELPDYQSLNQTFIDKLEKASAESKYQTRAECPDCYSPREGTVEGWWNDFHSSVKEIYDKVLIDYKDLLKALNTITRYNKKNRESIRNLIIILDEDMKEISGDERYQYTNFICKQDRYYLKAEDSIVNMSFLRIIDENSSIGSFCREDPVKIKVYSFNREVYNFLHSPEGQEVLDGFQSEANAGK